MRYPSWMMDQMEPDAADREPPQPATTIERCRSCGAPIWWGKTASGKACPFNVLLNLDGTIAEDEDGPLLVNESHFKTCNDPSRWSKKGAK